MCVTKTTTHTFKKLRKWPNRNRTTASSMALFGHYMAKNHPTKNAIERARHQATRRGIARRIYHSMASLLHC